MKGAAQNAAVPLLEAQFFRVWDTAYFAHFAVLWRDIPDRCCLQNFSILDQGFIYVLHTLVNFVFQMADFLNSSNIAGCNLTF